MVADKAHAIDAPLAAGGTATFLSLVSDADPGVRRAAVVSLSAVAHTKPALLASPGVGGAAPPLTALLPPLYEQTVVRPELIRTVDLGPFKHRVRVTLRVLLGLMVFPLLRDLSCFCMLNRVSVKCPCVT